MLKINRTGIYTLVHIINVDIQHTGKKYRYVQYKYGTINDAYYGIYIQQRWS